MKRILRYTVLLSIVLTGCQNSPAKRFEKLSASSTGLDFSNTLTATPELNILNYLYFFNGAGIAAADFNNDGLIDLYFTANQEADQLYLNKGNLRFEKITETAGIDNSGNWTTGVTHADVNNDGLLDIYVCKVGSFRNISGKNLLYINQGLNKEGIPEFKEEAESYGLDFSGFSTQAAFFDYDLDGDLDMFLLNHSVHPNMTYGKGSQRLQYDPASGDRLFKNEDGFFRDISEEAGIYQGRIGYGLGLGVSDLNEDGYPDLYVGNDFFENDYLYINQKDGTFKEIISADDTALGHTTHFSMGNDIADINNDGLTDIVSLDMLPEDLETYKTSGLEYPYPSYQYYLKNGYAPQFMQNTLHLNLGDGSFSEIGQLAGISATEWSWSVLLADYDNDGYKDAYISNGIKRATNDMDFINFISNDAIQRRLESGMSSEDMTFIEEIPQKKTPNYFMKNTGQLTFEDVTASWYNKIPSFSNGAVYADLDNDGDLEIIVNNVDEEALILKNLSAGQPNTNYLKISLQGDLKNTYSLGTKVIIYQDGKEQMQEQYVSRGFLSAVPTGLHFGLGESTTIDSLRVIWPMGTSQLIINPDINTKITLKASEAKDTMPSHFLKRSAGIDLEFVENTIPFRHKEPATLEFDRDPMVPFANTNAGPEVSVADVNMDGRDDLFISGAKAQPSSLFIQQQDGQLVSSQEDLFLLDEMNEDTSHVFFDANGDSWPDLLVVSGGNEFREGSRLQPRLYMNQEGTLIRDTVQFKNLETNASKVVVRDLQNDGDLDVLIASDQQPLEFGSSSRQYVYLNDGEGNFQEDNSEAYRAFIELPSVKDIVWADIDKDGEDDMVVAGYWEPITVLKSINGVLKPMANNGLQETNGWWNTLGVADFDHDGDLDLIAGNWGLNSRLKATREFPITLYRADFDQNGTTDPLVTYYEGGKETPFASKDELVKQMPFLNKEFLSYKSFAAADLEQMFTKTALANAEKKQLYVLRSIYLVNDGQGNFTPRDIPRMAQASIIHDIFVADFNKDEFEDILLVGNAYEISTQLGRLDAAHGIILLNNKKGDFNWIKSPEMDISGPARSIGQIKIKEQDYLIIGINNGSPHMFKYKE
ncbi:hypothetical protein EQY75_11345 [Muriicola soli]|uniref:ASPIC/UnbV domain-containing protein n=2 Tax=Muriicola soli TaxID=2507538 RepID=A0A411EDG3_9FLAO|nr:hypothetical protein EQY75_11345 [Muriicola soli]